MNIGALVASLGVNTADLDRATAKMKAFQAQSEASIKKVNANWATTGAAMKTFGRNMSMYVTAPMALVGVGALKMYSQFESSMTKVIGLVGVARSQAEEWSDQVLRMAPSLGKAPAELADALFFITSAGIRGAEAMDVLEMSAKASAAGLGETKVVADLVTSAMNAYGVANLSAAEATDVLVATVREGKAQADQLAQSMGMVLPIASYMSVSFAEVGGAIAAMTRTGTNAQTASVQLRQILNSLIKPTQQAEEALGGMKTSSAELRKTIKEDGLLAALMKVRELTNKYGEDTMSKVFPNIRALSGVLDIMGKNLDDNIQIFKSVAAAAGSLDMAFAEASQTLEFKWNQATATAKVAMTELGKAMKTAVVPMLANVSKRLQNITYWFRNLNEHQQQSILRWGAFVAAIGPVTLVLGMVVSGIGKLIVVGNKAVLMFHRLKVAMLTNPLLIWVAALAAVATALLIVARNAKKAAEAQNVLNNIGMDAEKSVIAQRKGIEQLLEIAQDEAKSMKERQAALNALNRASPEYFGNLKLETLSIETATKAKQAYITELIREAKVKGAQAELIRIEEERYKKINELEGARLKFGQKVGLILSSAVIGQSRAITNAYGKAQNNLKEMETELDASEKRVKDFLDAIITVEDLNKGLGLGDGGDGDAGLRAIEIATNSLAAEMAYAATMQEALGKSFDYTSHMIEANRAALDAYAREGLAATSDEIVKVSTALLAWESVAKSTKTMSDSLSAAEKDFDKLLETAGDEMLVESLSQGAYEAEVFNKEINDLILGMHGLEEKSNIMAGIMGSAFSGMANVISDALNSTENVFQAFGKFFFDFIKGMVIKLVAATAAAAALAIVLSLIPGLGAGNIFSGLTKASKFGDIFKAGFKKFGGGFQYGGVVPPGYPNDSFPALLTSGETITPAGQQGQGTHITVNVEGGVKGEDIYWIVKEVERKHSNSYS